MTPEETLNEAWKWMEVNVSRSAPWEKKLEESCDTKNKLKVMHDLVKSRKKTPLALERWIQEAIDELGADT
jgi:hypothetical protein